MLFSTYLLNFLIFRPSVELSKFVHPPTTSCPPHPPLETFKAPHLEDKHDKEWKKFTATAVCYLPRFSWNLHFLQSTVKMLGIFDNFWENMRFVHSREIRRCRISGPSLTGGRERMSLMGYLSVHIRSRCSSELDSSNFVLKSGIEFILCRTTWKCKKRKIINMD